MCVDGRHHRVWDSEEGWAVDLNADSVPLCSGIKSKNVRVRAFEMVAKREKKSEKASKAWVIELDQLE